MNPDQGTGQFILLEGKTFKPAHETNPVPQPLTKHALAKKLGLTFH